MLLGFEILKPCMFGELIKRLEREYLASGREDHLFHVFTTNAEAASAYAGDDLILWVVCRPTGKTQFSEVLNASHLVPSCAVVFGNLRFNNDLWVKLARNDEIGRLIEPLDTFRPFCFTVTDAGLGQHVLDGRFKAVTDQLADRIAMTGKRPPKKTLLKKHGIGHTHARDALYAVESPFGMGLVQTMQLIVLNLRYTFNEHQASRFH